MRHILIFVIPVVFSIFFSSYYQTRPIIHDEFSYLLQADTFFHGKLSNPAHPLKEHFETFQVLSSPYYVSRYPPGQSLALALGMFLSGKAIVGVWLSIGAAFLALFWMLRAFISSKWAFWGSLLMSANFSLIAGWGATYWGGALGMLGGCLLVGSAWRLSKNYHIKNVMIFLISIFLLYITRPFEGALLVSITSFLLFFKIYRTQGKKETLFFFKKFLVVLLPFFIISQGIAGIYNFKTTGDFFSPPYTEYMKKYAEAPVFTLQKQLPQKEYPFERMKDYEQTFSLAIYKHHQGFEGFINGVFQKIFRYSQFFFPIYFILSFILIFILFKQVKFFEPIIWAVSSLSFVFGACTLVIYEASHYFSPLAGYFALMLIMTIRLISKLTIFHKKIGKLLAFILIISFVGERLLEAQVYMKTRTRTTVYYKTNIEDLIKKNSNQNSKHLVIVNYQPWHTYHDEWVYNLSNIDEAPIVWARSLANNQNLINYFKDRKIWNFNASTGQLTNISN